MLVEHVVFILGISGTGVARKSYDAADFEYMDFNETPETNLNWFAFGYLVGFVRGEVAAYPMTKGGSRLFGSLCVEGDQRCDY